MSRDTPTLSTQVTLFSPDRTPWSSTWTLFSSALHFPWSLVIQKEPTLTIPNSWHSHALPPLWPPGSWMLQRKLSSVGWGHFMYIIFSPPYSIKILAPSPNSFPLQPPQRLCPPFPRMPHFLLHCLTAPQDLGYVGKWSYPVLALVRRKDLTPEPQWGPLVQPIRARKAECWPV